MALFDFLRKGLNASERKELDETKKTVSDLQKEIELLRKGISNVEGFAKAIDIPKMPDMSKYVLAKDIPKPQDTLNYWKNQNAASPIKSATLFIGAKQDKAPDNQLTIVP